MNFQSLTKVEKVQFYLDVAFSNATKAAEKTRTKIKTKDRLKKSKSIEIDRMKSVMKTLTSFMDNIIKSFPRFEELPEFYQELVKCTVDYVELKKALGSVNWASKNIAKFFGMYNTKIIKCRDVRRINVYRREFYGRISSILKQIDRQLDFLESVRRIMKGYPNVKTSIHTIAITGFPNVGKTTLLYKLTGSKPEIKAYAFTTKGINVGYYTKNSKKIQVLDTPGALNRFDKMNPIEKQAELAMKYCANKIIFVIDLTEPYPLKKQMELYNKIKKYNVPVIVYLSKKDILKDKIKDFKIKHVDVEEI